MLFRPTLLYLWFQNPKHSKTKKLFQTCIMAKPDLDEHEASGSLFYPQSEHIHKFGCRDVHVFGMLHPDPVVGVM